MYASERFITGGADGRLWRPGDGVKAFMDTLDIAAGPQGCVSDRIRPEVEERIRSFILASPRPEALMPGLDDGKPQPVEESRGGSSRHLILRREDYPVDPMGLDRYGNAFCRGTDGDMLYINPVFMYQDMLDLTEDPEGALSSMGFRRALRLSTLSRYRIGGMRNLKVSRRRLFRMAVEHMGKGDLDRMLDIVAATAYVKDPGIPGLPVLLRLYDGLPMGFIMECIGVTPE